MTDTAPGTGRFATAFRAAAPAGFPVPEPLLRAWDFMDARGWGGGDADAPYVAAYPGDRQLGPVFVTDTGTDAWVAADAANRDRLVVVAEADGSGGLAAMWLDDTGTPRFVLLDSEGGAPLRLADDAVDFLRLLAVGYDELASFGFGAEPVTEDDWDPVAAVAEFRAWVESTFDVEVPALWEARPDEEFAAWLEARRPEW